MPNFKNLLPRTLFGRFLLIIILPTLLAQGLAVYIFYDRHWASTQRNMAASLGSEIAALTNLAEEKGFSKDHIIKMGTDLGFNATIKEDKKLPPGSELVNYKGNRLLIAHELKNRLPNHFTISNYVDENDNTFYIIRIQLTNRVLRIKVSDKRLNNSTSYIFIMWMVGSALLLLTISIIFLHNQIKFISQMAEAASSFGKGHEIEGFKPRGAIEVRQAALAFIKMQERIKRQIEQRYLMLAGISHDLRTPLTRMKLQLALLGNTPEITSLSGDIDEMEKMIGGYINFAKGQEAEESREIKLSSLLEITVDNYRRQGSQISLKSTTENESLIKLRENAIKRMLGNIIDNAFRYGKTVLISSEYTSGAAMIFIDDDGPGIPPEMRDEVFKPFFRLDLSRNSETGGTGLGLAITRDIIQAHGGDIKLADSPLGGLRVIIRLPIN